MNEKVLNFVSHKNTVVPVYTKKTAIHIGTCNFKQFQLFAQHFVQMISYSLRLMISGHSL